MSEVPRMPDAAPQGGRKRAEELLPLLYAELRQLAAAKMAAEAPGHSLSATALVHEAYLRLRGAQQFDGRAHFFPAAAEAMRRILVNNARDRQRLKRGGGRLRLELLDQADFATLSNNEPSTCQRIERLGVPTLLFFNKSITAYLTPRNRKLWFRCHRPANLPASR